MILLLPAPLLPVVATLPIVLLLLGLTALNWSARKSAIAAFLLALAVAVLCFGLRPSGFVVAVAKGCLSALVVLLVVWAALLLYSLVERLGAIEAIGLAMTNSTGAPAVRALLIGWGFSGFLQGIAGFGAPVAAVVPLLRVAGFQAERSIAAAMVGHSWAITFGSMGSSYLAIVLVTRLDGAVLAPWIAALFPLAIVSTGLSVLILLLGWEGVRRAGLLVLLIGALMGFTMWVMASLGAAQVASTVPALTACLALWLLGRRTPPLERVGQAQIGFHLAFLPYYVLIALTIATQLPGIREGVRAVSLGFDFPSTATLLGYTAPAEEAFPRLRILSHPAPLILAAVASMAAVYGTRGRWPAGTFRHALRLTYRRSLASSTAVLFMVLTALVMTDAGMSRALASGIRALSGPVFPLLSPFVGLLGAFMTGSNTNSNILMGGLQMEAALGLGISHYVIAAAQTVGGALGSGVSPDKAVIGASVASSQGIEGAVARRALPHGLVAVTLTGLQTLALVWLGVGP